MQGWRGAFLVCGIPGIFLCGLMFLTGVDPPRTHKGKEKNFHHCHATGPCPPTKTQKLRVALEEFDNEDDQEDVIEYETSEAHVLIGQDIVKTPRVGRKIPFSLWKCCFDPPVMLLGIGACIRQAGNNNQ